MPAVERYQPAKILPRHRVIMRYQLQGLSIKQIARQIGMSEAAINYITKSDMYLDEFSKLNKQANNQTIEQQALVRQKIAALQHRAVLDLEDLLNDKETPAKLRSEICFDILDRGGNDGSTAITPEDEYINTTIEAYKRRKQLKGMEKISETPLTEESESLPDQLAIEDKTNVI